MYKGVTYREHYPEEMYYVNGSLYTYEQLRNAKVDPRNTTYQTVYKQYDGSYIVPDRQARAVHRYASGDELIHALNRTALHNNVYAYKQQQPKRVKQSYREDNANFVFYLLVSMLIVMFIILMSLYIFAKKN